MLGAIAGDVIGSIYEGSNIKTPRFFPLFDAECRFTDDTVLTVAVADTILTGADYVDKLKEYFWLYPAAGYGGTFFKWAASASRAPYNSWGNGSAMRVSPVGFAFGTLEEVLHEAKRSAEITHNHPEGVMGAQSVAAAVFLARTGKSKADIKAFIQTKFGYDLDRELVDIRPHYFFDVSCQGSVPEALIAFLESENYEDAVRKAVSLGGDSDTIACIAGGVAQAFYGGVPEAIIAEVLPRLDDRLRRVIDKFTARYPLASL
jgi:ADP-ribosylglycohydrolase